jgi:hypothetical protein
VKTIPWSVACKRGGLIPAYWMSLLQVYPETRKNSTV